MKPPRLLLISRQYWPSIGGAQIAMARLADALAARGAEVTVLTARWHRTWPAHYQHGRVRVVRLPQPAVRFWGTWRYMRALRRWLMFHREQYDLVYVSMLKHDAHVAIRSLAGTGVPVAVRAEGAGPLGDVAWHGQARLGRTIQQTCLAADALVAIAPQVRDELLDAGFAATKIHEIANGVPLPEIDASSRAAARRELAASDPRLDVGPTAPLAIFVGRLHAEKGLTELLDAWRRVAAHMQQARLWIVGDGPERGSVAARIEEFGLERSVTLAGSYDATSQFYQAADVFVFPSRCELMSLALLEAMAAGLKIIASDIPANRHLLANGQCGLLVPVGNAAILAEGIAGQLDNDQGAAAGAARQRAAEHFSLNRMTEDHWNLFAQLLGHK